MYVFNQGQWSKLSEKKPDRIGFGGAKRSSEDLPSLGFASDRKFFLCRQDGFEIAILAAANSEYDYAIECEIAGMIETVLLPDFPSLVQILAVLAPWVRNEIETGRLIDEARAKAQQ
jgi:hypothetical protein